MGMYHRKHEVKPNDKKETGKLLIRRYEFRSIGSSQKPAVVE